MNSAGVFASRPVIHTDARKQQGKMEQLSTNASFKGIFKKVTDTNHSSDKRLKNVDSDPKEVSAALNSEFENIVSKLDDIFEKLNLSQEEIKELAEGLPSHFLDELPDELVEQFNMLVSGQLTIQKMLESIKTDRDSELMKSSPQLKMIMTLLESAVYSRQDEPNVLKSMESDIKKILFALERLGDNFSKSLKNEMIVMQSKDIKTLNVLLSKNLTTSEPTEKADTTKAISNSAFFTGSMDKVQQYAIHLNHQGNRSNSSQQQQLVKELQQIISRSQMTNVNGKTELSVQLFPKNLGKLDVTLIQTNGILTARIQASTAMAKEMIDSQIHNLRQSLSAQNVTVEKIEVFTPFQADGKQSQDQSKSGTEQQGEQQHQKENQNDHDNEETKSFLQSLDEELLNVKV